MNIETLKLLHNQSLYTEFGENNTFENQFLSGHKDAILKLGDAYMLANGLKPIPYNEIAGFVKGSPKYLHEIGKGWGMSTADAIRCLFDIERTSIFIRGIVDGVSVLKNTFPGEEYYGVDAGTGTTILAIAQALAGIKKVFAVEINPTTAEYAQQFIKELGLADKIEIILADATRYTPPKKVHMITSENMHTGLFLEPQVQIINNLRRYLNSGGVVVPQGVSLSFRLAKANWEQIGKENIELRSVPKDQIKDLGAYGFLPNVDFAKTDQDLIRGIVPVDDISANALISEMDVHVGSGIIKSGEAEFLGQPHIVKIDLEKAGNHGFFYYKPGGSPPSKIHLF